MIGLPDQTLDDLKKSIELMKLLAKKFHGQSYFSINVFVPKLNTQLKDFKFDVKNLQVQIKFLKKHIGKLRFKISSLRLAKKEYELGRLNYSIDKMRQFF